MNRLEEFKHLRKHRKKCVWLLLFFLVLTASGVLVADYCMNSIVKNERSFAILKVENEKDSTIKLNILNKIINLQYSGVINDFDNMKKKLTEWGRTLLK